MYGPELTALLLSHYTRPSSGKPLKPSHLSNPPTLPLRADPSSEDARLFGPFSKRREVNIRWRHFSYHWKRLYPPLEVSVNKQGAREASSQEDAILGARIRGVGMQTAGLLAELISLTGSGSERPPTPRRIDPVYAPLSVSRVADGQVLPNRFLRRRYRELLGRIPILTYSCVPGRSVMDTKDCPAGKYEVSLAPNALSPRIQHEKARSKVLDDVDLAWFEQGMSC